jgi:hypothetical protein
MALTLTSKEPSTSKLVKTEESGHWYTEDGQSAHVIIGANGKERNTTVADARKLKLLPSVTSVLGILEKPNLTAWKVEQAIYSSLTLPRKDGEDLTDYAKRCVADSKEATTKAAQHGTEMHLQAENILLGRETSKEEALQPYIATFRNWAKENVEETYWCERALVGRGYAGRCDAYVRLKGIGDALIDLKNRKYNPKYEPFYMESDCTQLASYRECGKEPRKTQVACVSVVLPSNDPSKILTKQWDEQDLVESFAAFQSLLKIWAWLKNYTPPGMEL